jgi:hypothetical protein
VGKVDVLTKEEVNLTKRELKVSCIGILQASFSSLESHEERIGRSRCVLVIGSALLEMTFGGVAG